MLIKSRQVLPALPPLFPACAVRRGKQMLVALWACAFWQAGVSAPALLSCIDLLPGTLETRGPRQPHLGSAGLLPVGAFLMQS